MLIKAGGRNAFGFFVNLFCLNCLHCKYSGLPLQIKLNRLIFFDLVSQSIKFFPECPPDIYSLAPHTVQSPTLGFLLISNVQVLSR